MTENKIFDLIQDTINNNDIVLFMKGSQAFPECGFSATVVAILKKLGVSFKDVNVLASPEMRQAIKDFSDWPTVPQLYVKGEFIGGCDIVKEMFNNGEFQSLLKEKQIIT